MKKQLPNNYYSSDFRAKTAALAAISLLPLAGGAVGAGLLFYEWRIGLAVFTASVLLFKPLMKLSVEKNFSWGCFKNGAIGDQRVLYGDIEDLERADKFQLVPDDYGGIYSDGSDMILGSLEGETRCPKEHFKLEIISKCGSVAYLHIRMGAHEFAFTPKWDGGFDNQIIGPEKAAWGACELEKMMNLQTT